MSGISWREQVNFQWDDDEVRFVLVINHYQKVNAVTLQKCAIISFFSKRRKYCLRFFSSETDTKSTWMEAMTKCRHQSSTIESDATILKQHYLKVNEQFWLPAAVYKTTWTEQLGRCI